MPKKEKKRFIDKKNAVTFHLVHRSQRDPLQADDDAPNRVLLPVKEKSETRKEEQLKYGVYYDDDYDYLQHLRDVNELNDVQPMEYQPQETPSQDAKLNLPSSLFATDVETETGLLNKAAPLRGPQPDWDPDIVAGLEEDFDYEDPDNMLDDDFILMANATGGPPGITEEGQERVHLGDEEEKGEEDYPSDEADNFSDAGSFGDQSWTEEETKTRFTSYSLTSSVIKRSEGLTLLDNKFEKLYEQYEDDEIGALDHEEIEGAMNPESELLKSVLDDFEKKKKVITVNKIKRDGVEAEEDLLTDDEEDLVAMEMADPKDKWDCESILSTYSNLYNHPKVIEEPKKNKPIKLTKRLGIPADILPERGPSQKQIEKEIYRENQLDKAVTYRPKGESTDDRKMRKQAIKEERKDRRMEKKANKVAFKSEKMRQEKEVINLKNNLKGIKIA